MHARLFRTRHVAGLDTILAPFGRHILHTQTEVTHGSAMLAVHFDARLFNGLSITVVHDRGHRLWWDVFTY